MQLAVVDTFGHSLATNFLVAMVDPAVLTCTPNILGAPIV